MNLIEALKQANGKPVRRHSWIEGTLIKESLGGIAASSDGGKTWNQGGGGFLVQCKGNILADDWYVVEPKSKIEEAIEREFHAYIPYSPVIPKLRRVVNLALDEAKKAVEPHVIGGDWKLGEAYDAITALKVKE